MPTPLSVAQMRAHVRPILDAALAAVDPRAAVVRALRVEGESLVVAGQDAVPIPPGGRIVLVGAGKAAARMALGALDVLGERIAGGTVTVPDGHALPLPVRVDVWEAAHPVPDARGLAGAVAALRAAREAGPRDVVLCLLSGGASSLWPAPPPGVSLSDLRAVTDGLLRAGTPIRELNAVRKHLSRIAGGWLARAARPARVVTLVVSDVVGSPVDAVGSGPTVPDPTTFEDALQVFADCAVDPPASVRALLEAGAAGELPETPKPGEMEMDAGPVHVVARNRDALEAAARRAEELGYDARVVADDMEGEAGLVGEEIAALARSTRREAEGPVALLVGGETTVTVRGGGRGGRNQELALAAAVELEGEDGIVLAAFGTDGRDGPTPAAGAVVDGTTAQRGDERGVDAREHLGRNDSHAFLSAVGDALVTGPTGTNVNDVVLVLVSP